MRRLTSSTDERTLRAKTVEVPAKVNANTVWDAQPVAVTVSRDGKQARLFRRGKLVRTYTVAVGTSEFPTPTGRYVVQSMQKNPAWNVPQSEWAGELAGETIPGGDPRNPLVARWIGINGSVGFHGTASSGSLGTAASHGCIRMAPGRRDRPVRARQHRHARARRLAQRVVSVGAPRIRAIPADTPTAAPYGSWPSPISPAMIARGQVQVSETRAEGDATYWLESRPADGGRTRLMCHRPDGGVRTVTPSDVNCRTRVHEYGGGAYAVHDTTVFFVNFDDQRLYRLVPGSPPHAITEAPPQPCSLRYADMCPTPDGRRLVCVRERHEDAAVHNELVLVDADGAGPPVVLDHGHDFYSFPRVSPDGTRLAWTVWDHPNMPWDATELMVGELSQEGVLSEVRRVAGGAGESIFQPAWSPAGRLHFVSDRTGWGNLYELGPRGVRALAPMQAEAGEPQWTFGQSSYAFVPDGIAVILREGPRQRMALLSPGSAEVVDLPLAHTSFDVPYLRAAGNRLVFVAGGPTLAEGVVCWDRDSGRVQTLRTTLTVPIAPSGISVPREIAFPTSGGATAHALFYAPRNGERSGVGDELPPAIVVSHGGPTGQTSTCLDLAVQLWTSRGFAVIDVDYRGSTGYGRAYREALRGQWGVADVEDCVNAARHLAAEVDLRRLAIRGASAGGYTTLRPRVRRLRLRVRLRLTERDPRRRRRQVVEDQQLDERQRLRAVHVVADGELAERLGAQVAREVHPVPDALLDRRGALARQRPGDEQASTPSSRSSIVMRPSLSSTNGLRSGCGRLSRSVSSASSTNGSSGLSMRQTTMSALRRCGRMKASESGSRRSRSASTSSVV